MRIEGRATRSKGQVISGGPERREIERLNPRGHFPGARRITDLAPGKSRLESRDCARQRASGRVRMEVIPDFKAATLLAFLKKHVAPGATVSTDGLKSYTGLQEAGYAHTPRIQPSRTALRKGAKSAVPLADRAIGNLQQWLIGTHHGVSNDQLQVYLDEFVFRHNRRKQPMAAFQTLLGLGAARQPTQYRPVSYTHLTLPTKRIV